ncbi:hypothetical protein ACS15_4186 [Ralstonia insidiosa]|uniref:Uncharacterized protein n=1 Tax=Ralstonia insidiosa TaxID=190721 RepID=A0AAC9BPK0_9RALS|nr:hypothetical protein ACS15_4186 [Ralstonia insidiosa]
MCGDHRVFLRDQDHLMAFELCFVGKAKMMQRKYFISIVSSL